VAEKHLLRGEKQPISTKEVRTSASIMRSLEQGASVVVMAVGWDNGTFRLLNLTASCLVDTPDPAQPGKSELLDCWDFVQGFSYDIKQPPPQTQMLYGR
jgi:hypothetical protein